MDARSQTSAMGPGGGYWEAPCGCRVTVADDGMLAVDCATGRTEACRSTRPSAFHRFMVLEAFRWNHDLV